MVMDMKLEKQASIISFDPFKSLAAHKENPNIPFNFFYSKEFWDPPEANKLKEEYGNLPGMKTCVGSAPNGTDFARVMFQSGAVPKGINASLLDMGYRVYDNPKYSNNTFQVRCVWCDLFIRHFKVLRRHLHNFCFLPLNFIRLFQVYFCAQNIRKALVAQWEACSRHAGNIRIRTCTFSNICFAQKRSGNCCRFHNPDSTYPSGGGDEGGNALT